MLSLGWASVRSVLRHGGMEEGCYLCASLRSSFIFLRVTWLKAAGPRLPQKHLQISDMPSSSYPAERHGFFWSLDPKPRSSFIAGIDFHGLRKSPACTQPQQTLYLKLSAMQAPLPTAATAPYSDVPPTTPRCLSVSG